MHLTWLDSNTWLIEIGRQRILVDPWLVGPLVFGNLTWLFKSERKAPRSIPENIDLILLTQGLEDHAHPATLKLLDHKIPVVGSAGAAKVVQRLGYQQVITLSHSERFTLANQVEIQAFPGSPIGPQTVENSYLLRDLNQGSTLYYEPHGYHSPLLKAEAPVDVVITPLIDLTLPLLGSVIKGGKTTLELVQWLQPQVILPTATGGDVIFTGLLLSILRAVGSPEEFRSLLAQNNCVTRVVDPNPGERFALELQERAVNLA
jgi:L-ascorbate metabolism protein UlaG (beta-lactamase superfamily)